LTSHRFETMSFHKPILVGEVASCTCSIIFTSPQSILVEVVVHAEDLQKGESKITNTGWLWYVTICPTCECPSKSDWEMKQVPQLPMPKDESNLKKYIKAKAKYEKRKALSQSSGLDLLDEKETDSEFETFKQQYTIPDKGRTPSESEQVLCQMVLPGDCGKDKVAFGGFVMKLLDNSAGCSAWRHCRTNVVTVAISDMDFTSWVRLGDLCTIRSKVVFVSSKSIEVEVVASTASAILSNESSDTIVAKELFTFVSLDSDGKVLPIPKLRLDTDEDFRKAFAGNKRYLAAKKARQQGSS